MVKVTVTNTEFKDKEFDLTTDKVTVGRIEGNDIVLGESSLSSHHASFRKLPSGDYALEDLGSTNGTFLNGEKITAEKPLRKGDKIRFGQLMLDYQSDIIREKPAEKASETAIMPASTGGSRMNLVKKVRKPKNQKSPFFMVNLALAGVAALALLAILARFFGAI